MSIVTTNILAALSRATQAALECPSWCAEDDDHGMSSTEIRRSGGIGRQHRSTAVVAVETSTNGGGPITVQVVQSVDLDLDHGITFEQPYIATYGVPEYMTGWEAAQVAEALAEAAASLSAVVR